MINNQGTIAITARGDGSRWYGRISVTLELAGRIPIVEGDKLSIRWDDDGIYIYKDENGKIKMPAAKGKYDKKHAFEASTTTLGLKEIRLSQQDVHAVIIEDEIFIGVPVEYLAGDNLKKRKPRKKNDKSTSETHKRELIPLPSFMRKNGAAAVIVSEAMKTGKNVVPMTIIEVIEELKSLGKTIDIFGPRAFRMNGVSANAADLANELNKLKGSTEQNKIILTI